jgi:hypothetical protein
MEIQNTTIRLVVNEKEFTLTIPADVTYDIAFMASFQITNHILKMAEEKRQELFDAEQARTKELVEAVINDVPENGKE